MSADEIIFAALAPIGVPGTRDMWPLEERPTMPRYRYQRTGGGEFHADDANHAALPRYRVTLEGGEYAPATIDAFDEAISALGPCAYDEGYDDATGEFVSMWTFTLCEG